MKSKMEHEDDIVRADWPVEGLEQVENCPVCGNAQRRQLYAGLTDRAFSSAPGQWALHQCNSCYSAYLDPRPSPQTIHLAYQTYYTHTVPLRNPQQEKLSFVRWLKRAAGNGYLNRRYGGNLQPSSYAGGLAISALPRYRRAMDNRMRHLPALLPCATLLDVGFGNGAFLESAIQAGWKVAGGDPDAAAVENARQRGLNVLEGGIEAFSDQIERYDVITLNHVIEHVHEPADTLRIAFDLLKPGGCLYLETPNIESAGHKAFGEYWRGLEIPRHLTIFTWDSLNMMLKNAGFSETTRFVQKGLYPSLAGKSRAMQYGLNPNKDNKVLIQDYVNGAINDIKTAINFRFSEFITLMAYKVK